MKKTKALICIIVAGIFWGTSGIFVHFIAPYGYSSIQMAAARGTVSAICMSLWALICNRGAFRIKPSHLFFSVLSGVTMFLTAALYYASMQECSVSVAVVLMYTAPVFVTAYSVAFLGEKMTALKTAAIVMMLLGCSLVSGIFGGVSASVAGVLLGLASGISYSAYNIFTKIEMRKGCPAFSASLWCFVFMAISAVASCNPKSFVIILSENPLSILLLAGCGIFTCFAPYFLYTLALRDLDAGTASALGIIEPMAATVFSVAFLEEKLTPVSFSGIVLIIAAVVMLGKKDKKSHS